MISEHRAMIEDMHDTYFNFTLTVVLPATIRMTSNTAHAAIFKDFFLANTDDNTGHAMMRAFQKDVKRLYFDGAQTLHVVFHLQRGAARWIGKSLRLRAEVITLKQPNVFQKRRGQGTSPQHK